MRFRKQLIAFLSVLVLGGATLGAALAAPSSQSTEGDGSEAPASESATAPDPKAYLGLAVQPLTEPIRERLELPADLEGAVVVKAQRGSPAAEAGLHRGDVILSAGGVHVASPADLREAVRGMEPGDVLSIVYYRGGERHSVEVTLAERPHRNGGGGGGGDQPANPLRRFLSIFPKAVDGSFRVLGDDGEVQVYEMAQGSITEVGAASLTIEKATGETVTFDIGEDTVIVLNGETAELSDLEEGTHAVVLSVDGEVKAVMVGSPRSPRPGVESRPHLRGQLGPRIERLEQHFGQLRERLGERFGRIEEHFGQLNERFGQLRERMNRLHPDVEPSTADPVYAPPADATSA